MFSATLVALSLAASAFATVFVTAPIASTTCAASSNCTISWQDDGAAPSLAQFGASKVSIYVGNAQQQTMLQPITASVNVATTASILFSPDPTIGPNGNMYFIRFESLGTKDPNNAQYPALAFSAKFTLSGMTGTFNATIQAQINGQSTAPLVGHTATAVTTAAATAKATSSASTTSTAKTSTSSSGAEKLALTGATALLGVAAAAIGLFF